ARAGGPLPGCRATQRRAGATRRLGGGDCTGQRTGAVALRNPLRAGKDEGRRLEPAALCAATRPAGRLAAGRGRRWCAGGAGGHHRTGGAGRRPSAARPVAASAGRHRRSRSRSASSPRRTRPASARAAAGSRGRRRCRHRPQRARL
ncbi:MAG: hypothetical protein AVDCRST_MAG50-816, partial [uncultured Acidimicrobiales bacterium]